MQAHLTYNIDLQRSKKAHTVVLASSKNEYIALKPIETYEKLQTLALAQKLFIDNKRLAADFFSRLQLEYLVEGQSRTVSIHATLANRALDEYDLIAQGSPLVAIRGGLLSFCNPDLGWNDIAPFLNGPLTLTKEAYQKFKRDIDPERLVELTIEEEQPQLMLVDATCSFANVNGAREDELSKAGFTRKDLGNSTHYCPTDRSLAAIKALIGMGWKVSDAAGREVLLLDEIEVAVQHETEITGKVRFKNTEASLSILVDPVQSNAKLALLNDRQVGLLSFENYPEVKELLEHVEFVSTTVKVPKKHLFCLNAFTTGPRLDRQPDTSFQGTLRPYQQEGLNWLIGLYERGLNGLLADEMGLGKTVQLIAFLSCYEARALIVAPTSLLENWLRELERFLPTKRAKIYHGKGREHTDSDILITSYGTLRRDVEKLKTIHFDMLIFDEAQAIKNSATESYQAASELHSPFRLLLTGTPVENSVSEVVSHFSFLEPGLIDEKEPLGVIRKKIAPFFLRRKKSDVAKDLPDKVDEAVFIEMTDEQKELYASYQSQFKNNLLKKVALDGIESHRVEVFEAILRLRQIACHPQLVPQIAQTVATSGKFEQALDDIQILVSEGKKVILFSQFTSMLRLFASRLTGYLLLEGQTQNRQALVDSFQNDPNYPIFLISLKAGGTGLNLTRADYVLLFDPWWNKAQEEQAVDRAHRIGRKDTVFIKRYYSLNTIEEKILQLQESKGSLEDALFSLAQEKCQF